VHDFLDRFVADSLIVGSVGYEGGSPVPLERLDCSFGIAVKAGEKRRVFFCSLRRASKGCVFGAKAGNTLLCAIGEHMLHCQCVHCVDNLGFFRIK